MRASRGPEQTAPDQTAPVATVVAVARRRLPRPVVWLLWLLGALLGSVVLGFLAGLARPREPDPWSVGPPASTDPADPVRTTSSDSSVTSAEDD